MRYPGTSCASPIVYTRIGLSRRSAPRAPLGAPPKPTRLHSRRNHLTATRTAANKLVEVELGNGSGSLVKSMLSWLGYMKHGEPQARALGMKQPPPNLQPEFDQQARAFVDGLAPVVRSRQTGW